MSVNIFLRATKLTDVCGRIDYATSSNRQEHLLATASTVDDPDFWKRLAKDSQAAFLEAGGVREIDVKGRKVKAKCCEARELIIDLPNQVLNERDLQALAKEIVEEFKKRTGAECVVGIHLNEAENNLHVHLIFSEREILPEPVIRIADRNAFIDEEGRRRRTKKEILDDEGQLRPGCRIVPKGEVISERYFGDKNPMFKDMGWLYDYKHQMAEWINENLDPDEKREVFDKFGPYLAQRHVGKAKYSKNPEIRKVAERNEEWNKYVKAFNDLVKRDLLSKEAAISYKTEIALAPDQLQELKAVMAHLHCSILNMPPDYRKAAEYRVAQAGKGTRTKVDQEAVRKEKLRDAYRRSKLAWQKYRSTEEGTLERRLALVEARQISAEILRRERELGYDRPKATSERRQDVWDAFADDRAAYAENEKLKAYKERVAKRRAAAAEKLGAAKLDYQALGRRASRAEKEAALDEIKQARAEYAEVRRESQMLNQAYQLQKKYRSFALELASDPNISQADADRALEKYKAAARKLQDPTPEKVKELQRQFSDLQKSQKIRNEKAAAERAAALENAEDTNGNFAGNR